MDELTTVISIVVPHSHPFAGNINTVNGRVELAHWVLLAILIFK